MRIVKLPDGRLRIPVAAAGEGWAADGTEIIGADDPRYPDYLPLALTEDEHVGRDRENAVTNADLLARWGTRYEAQHGHRTA